MSIAAEDGRNDVIVKVSHAVCEAVRSNEVNCPSRSRTYYQITILSIAASLARTHVFSIVKRFYDLCTNWEN